MAAVANMDSSSDSSDSDEEMKKRLREAAVDGASMIPDVQSSGHPGAQHILTSAKKNGTCLVTKPSLRPAKNRHNEEQELETTPQFRNFVATKLTAIIDSNIEMIPDGGPSTQQQPSTDSDCTFHLFSTSQPGDSFGSHQVAASKRRISSDSSSDSEEEKLASVAVSGDFILSQSEQLNKQSQLESITVDNSTASTAEVKQGSKKKKKKKKRSKDVAEACDGAASLEHHGDDLDSVTEDGRIISPKDIHTNNSNAQKSEKQRKKKKRKRGSESE